MTTHIAILSIEPYCYYLFYYYNYYYYYYYYYYYCCCCCCRSYFSFSSRSPPPPFMLFLFSLHHLLALPPPAVTISSYSSFFPSYRLSLLSACFSFFPYSCSFSYPFCSSSPFSLPPALPSAPSPALSFSSCSCGHRSCCYLYEGEGILIPTLTGTPTL